MSARPESAVQQRAPSAATGDDDEKGAKTGAEEAGGGGSSEKVTPAPTFVLLGDSVLDNFYWLEDHKMDVEAQLKQTFKGATRVVNLAVDESVVVDVLNGCQPAFHYQDARKDYGMAPYPKDKRGNVVPLEILKKMKQDDKEFIGEEASSRPIGVLSAGGNDFRAVLHRGGPAQIMQGLVENRFEEQYTELVLKLTQEIGINLILVMVYEPHNSFLRGMFPREGLVGIMHWGAGKLFSIAEAFALPVIDLSRTFDPWNKAHYGSTPIEPSNLSGQFICDLVHYVHENYRFGDSKQKSQVFYGLKSSEQGITCEENNAETRGKYMAALLARKKPGNYDESTSFYGADLTSALLG